MSQSVEAKTGPAIGALHEVRATFGTPEALQEAVGRLETAGFDRADLSLPEIMAGHETPDAGARPVDTEEDARQARTLHTSGAAAVAGMAAAGVVIATGGAAAPAVAAAVLGGGAAGGLAFALSSASNDVEQRDREQQAAAGILVLAVHTRDEQRRSAAEAILRDSGGQNLEIQ